MYSELCKHERLAPSLGDWWIQTCADCGAWRAVTIINTPSNWKGGKAIPTDIGTDVPGGGAV